MLDDVFLLVVGGIFGWLLSQVRVVWSENAHQIEEHISDIQRLSDAMQEYWLTTPESHDAELRLAARVRAYHAAVTHFYGDASNKLSLNRYRDYQVLQLRLLKVGLGGKFETNGRTFDGQTAIEAYDAASALIHLLRLARKEQLSFGALLSRKD